MSYATLQKDLEHITLKRDLDRALERMVDFEQEVNRKEEEEESEEEEEEESEEDESEESEERLYNFIQVVKGYIFGITLGVSLATIHPYINGRSKNNKR